MRFPYRSVRRLHDRYSTDMLFKCMCLAAELLRVVGILCVVLFLSSD